MSENDSEFVDKWKERAAEREPTESQAAHDSLYSNPEAAEEYLEEQNEEIEKSDERAIIAALDDAITKGVWWGYDRDSPDLSKAPTVWRADEEVPEQVREMIKEIVRHRDVVWDDYEDLPPGAALRIEEMIEEKLTQPQGWSVESIVKDLQREFGMDDHQALTTARDETAVVLKVTRERAYDEMEGSEDFVYDWIGPTDDDTTPICLGIEEELERRGPLPKNELKTVLQDHAAKHQDEGGTPGRCGNWHPHFQCRRVQVRKVQSF